MTNQLLTRDQATQYALRLVRQRPYSRARLGEKLRWRGASENDAQAIVRQLTSVGILDDRRYAEMLAHHYLTIRRASLRATKQELRRRGLDANLQRAALEPTTNQDASADSELKRALHHIGNYSRRHPNKRANYGQNLVASLARKGFMDSVIKTAIKTLPSQSGRSPES